MKLSRFVAGTAGLALAASAVLLSSPAHAATGDVTFVTAADIPLLAGSTFAEGFQYIAPTAPESTLAGLAVAEQTGIYLGVDETAGGQTWVQALGSISIGGVSASVQVASGYYSDSTTSVPFGAIQLVPGSTLGDPGALWYAIGFGSLPPGTYTLTELDIEAAASLPNFQIHVIAFADPDEIVLTDLFVAGTQYIFTPEPVVTTAPGTTSLEDATSTGVTVTTNGFVPGETVSVGFANGGSGGPTGDTVVADATGTITFTYVLPGDTVAGTYTLSFFGAVPSPQFFTFDVTAPAAVVVPPVDTPPAVVPPVIIPADTPAGTPPATLPATGLEPTAAVLTSATLLLAGAALALFSYRRSEARGK